ncbi:MAG: hypothetical protein AAF490_31565 [Chloroflexota bacterium]
MNYSSKHFAGGWAPAVPSSAMVSCLFIWLLYLVVWKGKNGRLQTQFHQNVFKIECRALESAKLLIWSMNQHN